MNLKKPENIHAPKRVYAKAFLVEMDNTASL